MRQQRREVGHHHQRGDPCRPRARGRGPGRAADTAGRSAAPRGRPPRTRGRRSSRYHPPSHAEQPVVDPGGPPGCRDAHERTDRWAEDEAPRRPAPGPRARPGSTATTAPAQGRRAVAAGAAARSGRSVAPTPPGPPRPPRSGPVRRQPDQRHRLVELRVVRRPPGSVDPGRPGSPCRVWTISSHLARTPGSQPPTPRRSGGGRAASASTCWAKSTGEAACTAAA